jgi:hypothetical protein
MKLTQIQIDQLYQFTRQHYVEWYDLQTELVDHLANAIEEQWQKKPKLSFEDALQIEFKKFGVFGFMDVVEKRQAGLGKKYNRLIWKHFKEFFTIPKLFLTVTLILGLFLFFKLVYFYEIVVFAMISLFLLMIPALILERKKLKKRTKKTGKKWLFEEIISGYGSFSGLLILPFHVFNVFSNNKVGIPNDFLLFGISFFIISLFLSSYIVIFLIPSKAEEYLKATYPEYELANSL